MPALGEFVPAEARCSPSRVTRLASTERPLRRSVVLGLERTLEQDAAYGFRLLVDIAERSLSDSPFHDPTTAVQAIDRLHDCLRHLATCRSPTAPTETRTERCAWSCRPWTGSAYVRLAFVEIRQAGARSPQVSRRLAAALDDLLELAPPERQDVLRDERKSLERAAAGEDPIDADVQLAVQPDRQGLGQALA